MLSRAKSKRSQRWMLLLYLMAGLPMLSGCRAIGYYAQAIKGQCQVLARQEPVAKVLTNATTPEALRRQLLLTTKLRAFAERELSLPVNGHYRRYADLGRPFVVWNVQAAREFSLQPKTWWYPIVGNLEYRGYFSREGAEDYARYLEGRGYDIFVGGISAYSTLGWFKDPLLNTFVFDPEPILAETLFHELAHQRAFAGGDTDFNEAFATTVGEEGAKRWLRAGADQSLLTNYLAQLQRTREFVALTGKARQQLESLYGDWRNDRGEVRAARHPPSLPPETLRQRKEAILEELRRDYQNLNLRWGGTGEDDAWFERLANNAQLNSVAAYYDLVPAFERLLKLGGNDLEKFYAAVGRLAKMSTHDRHAWMLNLVDAGSGEGATAPLPAKQE
jgi:predicted aminopeptidase